MDNIQQEEFSKFKLTSPRKFFQITGVYNINYNL